MPGSDADLIQAVSLKLPTFWTEQPDVLLRSGRGKLSQDPITISLQPEDSYRLPLYYIPGIGSITVLESSI